ncbi:DegT/DnrJ/EryC1/StrS family aminotransferase [Bacteroidia bacterium]|jgi:dTDP-4-amino-4,6-dideoxygalactose transaminase|nr:DegT/DnrJ/EryC1/StrS family aminotransferase [Bacteroidia bacterium]
MKRIQMADLVGQFKKIKTEVYQAWEEVLENASFINGPQVKKFASNLELYLNVKHVIPCANGTDALQAALMALNLPKGSEIITPSFSYAALAEMIIHVGHKPVFVEVDPSTFTIDVNEIEEAITDRTKVIAPVHLYGQCADMNTIMKIAQKHNLYVIEDAAQAIGANYEMDVSGKLKAGTIGHIGTTSFFPSKNLGCYGDGGAIFTNDDNIAEELRMIVNHGQVKKYVHKRIGLNSRLDSIQAAVLNVKLKYLDDYGAARKRVAAFYDEAFAGHQNIIIPKRQVKSEHVFHQYTLTLKGIDRALFKEYLMNYEIPSMIYYPIPLHKQEAYKQDIELPITMDLTENVISLPISTELDEEQLAYICKHVLVFCKEQTLAQ